jgi:hypothetical protein
MLMLLLNEYGSIEHRDPVGLTTVRRKIQRLRSVIRKIRKRKQGSKYVNSPWAKARLQWVTQLLVRLGKHTFQQEESCNA